VKSLACGCTINNRCDRNLTAQLGAWRTSHSISSAGSSSSSGCQNCPCDGWCKEHFEALRGQEEKESREKDDKEGDDEEITETAEEEEDKEEEQTVRRPGYGNFDEPFIVDFLDGSDDD
jgi:hypothetical protein